MTRERSDLVDAIVGAPAGASLLAALELPHVVAPDDRPHRLGPPPRTDPGAVEAAADAVAAVSFGDVMAAAVGAAERYAGPWSGESERSLPLVLRDAPARRPIAEAVVARFGPQLEAGIDLGAQEWWMSDLDPEAHADVLPSLSRLDEVYCCGEFPWGGVWGASGPKTEAHQALATVWEIEPEPVTRWRLPVATPPRVWEIHRPEDWARLVEAHPSEPSRLHSGWELPGPNQHVGRLDAVFAISGQRAVQAGVLQRNPDWRAVADAWDGVHLSWAGFLTSEGTISTLPDGSVTMLRYWSSERTRWLRDVFGEPEPLPSPALLEGAGLEAALDAARAARDRRWLVAQLGR